MHRLPLSCHTIVCDFSIIYVPSTVPGLGSLGTLDFQGETQAAPSTLGESRWTLRHACPSPVLCPRSLQGLALPQIGDPAQDTSMPWPSLYFTFSRDPVLRAHTVKFYFRFRNRQNQPSVSEIRTELRGGGRDLRAPPGAGKALLWSGRWRCPSVGAHQPVGGPPSVRALAAATLLLDKQEGSGLEPEVSLLMRLGVCFRESGSWRPCWRPSGGT